MSEKGRGEGGMDGRWKEGKKGGRASCGRKKEIETGREGERNEIPPVWSAGSRTSTKIYWVNKILNQI